MKKLTALLLAAIMVFSLGTTAFAVETGESTETTTTKTADESTDHMASIDVTGNYLSQLESDEIISVDVAWEDMHFIYYASQQGTWDPETHTYTGATDEGKWNKETSEIAVTNHSNTAIKANLSFTSNNENVYGLVYPATLSLANAATESLKDPDKAPSGTSIFGIVAGTLDSTSSTNLGTITVSIGVGEWTVVSTYEELAAAMEVGGNIKLGADITTEESVGTDENSFHLDLDGHTLTCYAVHVYSQHDCVIANGTICGTGDAAAYLNACSFTIQNCTLKSDATYALKLESSEATAINSTIEGVLLNAGSLLTATENVIVKKGTVDCGINVKNGLATFGFDPTALKDNEENTVVENGDGTWTIYATMTEEVFRSAMRYKPQVILSSDITLTSALQVGREVTLDLNGRTISWAEDVTDQSIKVSDTGNLTINDSGTNGKINGIVTLQDGGILTIKGGTYTFDPTAYVDTDSYSVVINGCDYTVTKK